MAVFSKQILSESVNGLGILMTAVETAGTTIHAAHATSTDEVWLWAHNAHTAAVDFTIEFGGAVDPGNVIVHPIPNDDGLHLIVPGLPLTNSLEVAGFDATGSVVTIFGYVNRIT